MMDAVFQAPKRRPRVYEAYDAPFPVPLAAVDARLQQTLIYRADMVNQHVVVRDPEHIQALYGKGYFGKGILSRSRPDHSISHQWESEKAPRPNPPLTRCDAGPIVGRPMGLTGPGCDIDHHGIMFLTDVLWFCVFQQGRAGPGTTLRRVCRVNPFRLLEYLQLTLEEAFFLVYALGCLSVYYNEEPLSVLQLWEMFRSVQPHFETSYMAYHYFRSRGWVPKPGVKYGTDLMLYRKGPPFYHASYSVVVEKVDQPCRGGALRPFSWRSLAALSRITGNVSKDLMLCYVIYPSHLTEEHLSSPDCLCRVKVQEIILSRWISSRERTETDDI
uniref:tRNA-splicing endonuclease subunit Sen2 n=1 Tax=Salmo trutta TaxID=8032 RepID=A0A674C202_SALTR